MRIRLGFLKCSLILGKKGISVRKIVSKTRQKALAFVVMNHQSPLKSLLSEGFCEFLTKEMHTTRLYLRKVEYLNTGEITLIALQNHFVQVDLLGLTVLAYSE